MHVGVDVGGTKTLVGIFSDGELIKTEKILTPSDFSAFMDELSEALLRLNCPNPDSIKVAIAMRLSDSFVALAGGNLTWTNIDLKSKLSLNFNCSVSVGHDVNAAVLYEARHGNGKKYNRVVYITLSTGIGVGFAVEKKLVSELSDPEPGQMLLKHGNTFVTWETIASAKSFKELFNITASECEDEGVWRQYAELLTPGISAIISTFQADSIIFGGSMGKHFAKYSKYLEENLSHLPYPDLVTKPELITASESENAVLLGTQELD